MKCSSQNRILLEALLLCRILDTSNNISLQVLMNIQLQITFLTKRYSTAKVVPYSYFPIFSSLRGKLLHTLHVRNLARNALPLFKPHKVFTDCHSPQPPLNMQLVSAVPIQNLLSSQDTTHQLQNCTERTHWLQDSTKRPQGNGAIQRHDSLNHTQINTVNS